MAQKPPQQDPSKPDTAANPPAQPPAETATESAETPKVRQCGTMLVHQRLLRTDPEYVRARMASENHHNAVRLGQRVAERVGMTSIPVVVHVVFNTNQQNVSDAQVRSQIDVLNRDYRRTNSDASSVPAPFRPLAGDARIQFTLATTDPNGAVTNGITRTHTGKTSFNSETDDIKSAASGGHDAWPADRYLNIWTGPRLPSPQGDLLGYAQFPGGPAATDGVVILHSAFGTTGTAAAPFNLGRSATHEVGHWLNLRHIWGDDGNGCNGSDFVDDTPNQAGPNFGAPTFPHVTCLNGPNGDMFMNYMDYVDDRAMFMFTAGQVVRMQACLDGDRSTIGSSVGSPTTLKFNEDNPITLKFNDDVGSTLKFREDVPITLKFRDDIPKLKILDDGVHNPFGGIGPGPIFGVGGVAGHGPAGRSFASRGFGGGGVAGGGFAGRGFGGQRASPFVLSTPHHSMAWVQSFPQAAMQAVAQAEQQLQQYEDVLNQYAQADAAGQLSHADRQQAEALYQDYMALLSEYQQMTGRQA